jgi:dolichol-phosphate mannosyltransferase
MISKRVAEVVTTEYPERTRFLRGLIQSVGFKKASIPFVAPNRAAGQSKYSLTRLFFFSLSAIATFSHIPLRLGLAIGLLFGGFSFVVAIYSVVMKFLGEPFSGYTTIVVLISLGFSLLFIVIGIIGEYIGYIFNEVKGRPTYIIDRINE